MCELFSFENTLYSRRKRFNEVWKWGFVEMDGETREFCEWMPQRDEYSARNVLVKRLKNFTGENSRKNTLSELNRTDEIEVNCNINWNRVFRAEVFLLAFSFIRRSSGAAVGVNYLFRRSSKVKRCCGVVLQIFISRRGNSRGGGVCEVGLDCYLQSPIIISYSLSLQVLTFYIFLLLFVLHILSYHTGI